ncbi:MAG: DUF975 family protein [Rikenellaceae bacterium]
MVEKRNSEFRSDALAKLKGNWIRATLCCAICFATFMVIAMILVEIAPNASFPILGTLMTYMLSVYFYKLTCGRISGGVFSEMLGSKGDGDWFFAYWLADIFTALWALLLIVPGIVKHYSYAMTLYVAMDKGLKGNAAINESMRIMKGHRMRLFKMDVFFYILSMLSVLTFGVAMFWIYPWWKVSKANFYLDLKSLEAEQPVLAGVAE